MRLRIATSWTYPIAQYRTTTSTRPAQQTRDEQRNNNICTKSASKAMARLPFSLPSCARSGFSAQSPARPVTYECLSMTGACSLRRNPSHDPPLANLYYTVDEYCGVGVNTYTYDLEVAQPQHSLLIGRRPPALPRHGLSHSCEMFRLILCVCCDC